MGELPAGFETCRRAARVHASHGEVVIRALERQREGLKHPLAIGKVCVTRVTAPTSAYSQELNKAGPKAAPYLHMVVIERVRLDTL